MKTIVSAGLFLLPFAAAVAAPPASFDPQRLSNHVKVLASDAFEGRGPATAGETKTIAYIVDQMKAAGLQPGGASRAASAAGRRTCRCCAPRSRARRASPSTRRPPQPLAQGDQIAVRAAMTGAHHVSIAGAPLVFVGYGVKAPERNWDDFKGVDLHGKIMVVLVNDPDFETGQGDFGGKAMTYYGRWTYKYEEAARQGAAGVLVIHETGPASYGWNTVKNSNTNTQFDIVRANPARAHTPMEGWIQRDLAVDLFRASGLDFEALKKQAQSRDFRPVPLEGDASAPITASMRR
jgi:hypothetical protein